MEKFIINDVLKDKRLPFAHIVFGNEASLKLQSNIEGVEIAEGTVLWHGARKREGE
jgi:hypothetical protein